MILSEKRLAKQSNPVFGSPDMYRRLVEGLRVGIYVADAVGNLIYVNQAFADILGYGIKDDLIGRNLANEIYVHPQDRAEFLSQMGKCGHVRDFEVRNKRRDGSYVWVSVTSTVIRGEGSEIIGIQGAVYDMTETNILQRNVSVLRKAIDQAADHVMITDRNGFIEYVNPAFEHTTGYSREEVLGKTPKILNSGKQSQEYYQSLWDAILAGKAFSAHAINKKKNGELYIADQTISPVIGERGEVLHFISIWKDITEQVKLEDRLKTEKSKLEEIIGFDEKLSDMRKSEKLMDFIVEKTATILEANKCSLLLLDKADNQLCLKARTGVNDDEPIRVSIGEEPLSKVMAEGAPLLTNTQIIVPLRLDGKVIGAISVADKRESGGGVFEELDLKVMLAIAREVVVALENVRFYKELKYLTMTDSLTGIYNYRHFVESLDYEIKRARRFENNVALLMIDIDDFKAYNDAYGHPAGDKLLNELSALIAGQLREVDVFCRYAGDEFAIILPSTGVEGARIAAEKIRAAVGQGRFKKEVSVSIGIAQFTKRMTRQDLVVKADRALYEAKKRGKNAVCALGE